MREFFEQFLSRQQEPLSFSHQLHNALLLPGFYTLPRSLRDLYFETGLALLDLARFKEASIPFEQALKADRDNSHLPDWVINVYLAAAYQASKENLVAFHTYLVAVLEAPHHAQLLLECAHQLLTRPIARAESKWLMREWITICNAPRLDPLQLASINLFLGRIHLYLDQPVAAVNYFEQALSRVPDDVRVLEGLGQALRFKGETARAVNILRRAYELASQGKRSDRLREIHVRLVQALVDDGQYSAAISYIPTSLSTDSPYAYEYFIVRSYCHLALGEPAKALKSAELAAQSRPEAGEPYLLKAQAYIARKKYKKAGESTNEALQRDPSNNTTLFYQAQALIEGHIDLSRGRRLLQSYREDNVEEAIRKRIRSAPFTVRDNDASMHYFLAQLYFTLASYQESEQELDRVFALQFSSADSRLKAPAQQLKGELLLKNDQATPQQREQAATCFYEAGTLFFDQAAYVDAEVALQRAIALRPGDALSYLYRAASLILLPVPQGQSDDQKKMEQALAILQEGANYGIPPSHIAWSFYIRSLGLQFLASTLQAQHAKASLLYWEEAYYLERTILLSSDGDTYQSLLGFCYTLLERPITALETLPDKQIEPSLIGLKAVTLAAMEDEHAADGIEQYHQQLEQNPGSELSVDSEIIFSWFLYLHAKLQEAIKWLDASIEFDANIVSSWLLRGRIHRMLGNHSQADADFQHVWEVTAPDQPLATRKNMLARANAGYELTHYMDAINLLQQCLENPTSDPFDIYTTLALCYLTIQNLPKAKQAFQDALVYLNGAALELHSLLQDLAENEQFHLREQAHTEAVQEVITPYREALQKKYQQAREQAGHNRGAARELLQPIEQGEYEAGTFPWLASLAGAARIALHTQQLSEAITLYERLLQYDRENKKELFPEARWGLVHALSILSAQKACDDKTEEALTSLHYAIQLCIEANQDNTMPKIVQEVYDQIHSPQEYQAITEVLHLITSDLSLETQQRRELIIAQLNLGKEMYQQFYVQSASLTETDTQKLAPQFVADGYLALELGPGLIEESLVQEVMIDTGIPAMRDRVRQNMGVIIPGIQLRDNLGLPFNDYEIVFYNGLRVRGTIPAAHSSSFMRDAYNAILSHMEAVLDQNLDILLGIQEVQFTLNEWKREQEEERNMLIKEALPDEVAIAEFSRVLRSLVKEHLSIANLGRILHIFKNAEEREAGDAIEYVVGKIRRELTENAKQDY